jgi:hypothetical protein
MQGKLTNIFEATPENIWNYKQNHPELVIKDLQSFNLPIFVQDIVRQSMLARGINKWLKVRRDLIAYKKLIKHQVKELMIEVSQLKKELKENYVSIQQFEKGEKSLDEFLKYNNTVKNYLVAKDKLKLLQKIRGDLKSLCMTERWQLWENKKLKDMNTIRGSD